MQDGLGRALDFPIRIFRVGDSSRTRRSEENCDFAELRVSRSSTSKIFAGDRRRELLLSMYSRNVVSIVIDV
jgi:hypothetical protein